MTVLAAIILLSGLVLVVLGTRPPPPRTFQESVKELLPDPELVTLAGWKVDFQPIADTPEMKAKVDELLNYDDAVFAVYTKGAERISVYIAYWAPGKMSHRLVAGHTPDVCWVGAGWKTLKAATWKPETGILKPELDPLALVLARIAPLMRPPNNSQPITNNTATALLPAEYRVMELNHTVEHVAFWHLLDGESKSYGIVGTVPWHAMLTDIFTQKLNQQPEQLFIRISGNASVFNPRSDIDAR